MSSIEFIFGFYDKLISPLSTGEQAIISLVLLAFLIWQIFMIFKSGHWIFIVALIIFLPGTWPASKQIFLFVWQIIKFLYLRIVNFF